MEDMLKQLEEAGLSGKESQVYLALLKEGLIGGGELAKLLNMDRTHTYGVVRNLVNKGLVGQVVRDKKNLFQATSPCNLLNEIKSREQVVKTLIPKLESLEKIKSKDFSVVVLEGKSGMRTLLRTLLESRAKEILVYGATGKSYSVLEYDLPHAAKKIALLKMNGRIITSKGLKEHVFTKLPNFDVKYVDYDVPSSTIIFGNRVAFNVFDDKPVFVLIESASVSESHKKYFEYMWGLIGKG